MKAFLHSIFRNGRKLTLTTSLLISTSIVFAGTNATMAFNAEQDMVLVKGGTFKMGNTMEETFEDELPVNVVTLNDYYIGRYEVTQEEYQALMGVNPSFFKGQSELPVENISWLDAVTFCNKLSEKQGLTPCYVIGRHYVEFNAKANGYRLPTEAEWEFAARGGTLSKGYLYSGSNSLDEVAWYKDNSKGKTQRIASKIGNELGLYDMSGNVWEWCWDWYKNSYEGLGGVNPLGPTQGTEKVRRGGSWHIKPTSCRSTNRLASPQDLAFNYVGIRLARNK